MQSNLERLKKLEAEATPGPWRWRNAFGGDGCPELVSPPGGMLLVIDAVRHGMNGADLRFAIRTGRKGGLMFRARELVPKPSREIGDFPIVTNPDMALIAEFREALPLMLAVVTAAEKLHHASRFDEDATFDAEIELGKALAAFNAAKIGGANG